MSETDARPRPGDPDEPHLALYQTRMCPYCVAVRRTLKKLDLDVEIRDLREDPQHRRDLIAARGRGTVPVLRITEADGSERWMPESMDIIAWLEDRYGDPQAARSRSSWMPW